MSELMAVEFEIRQLHARYQDAVWRKDYDTFADCFAEDAEWRVGGRIMRGRAEILANIKRLLPMAYRILMTFRTPILELGPNGTASSRTYVTENNVFVDGRPGSSIGIYYERFVRQPDRWRFKWRLFQTHYVGPADITGPLYENPEWGPPPNMPPLDAPTYDHTGISAKAWSEK
jgi:ketosteroid isomerase-like protein